MKILGIIQRVLYFSLISACGLTALVLAAGAIELPGGSRLFTVLSGSMEPAIKTGSMVLVSPQEKYIVGDVITFKTEAERNSRQPKETITHRITGIIMEEGMEEYITKGDANSSQDGGKVDKGLVVGKTVLTLPYLGYIGAYAKTQAGLIILVIIPATLIIYSEMVSIKNEIVKMLIARQNRQHATKTTGFIIKKPK